MTDDAHMTMKTMNAKLLRALVASMAGLGVAVAIATTGSLPGVAVSCQRSVAIDPQVTVSEATNTLSFVVHTGSCAAAGYVSYTVTDGTARRPADFLLGNGRLQWGAGDTSSRRITATIVGDALTEAALEDFRITLVYPSRDVRIAAAVGQGRIFDNDTPAHLATVDSQMCLVGGNVDRTGSPSPSPSPLPTPSPSSTCTIEPGHIIIAPIIFNVPNATDQAVLFETSDGDLRANIDYVPVRRMVIVPAGSTAAFVEIRLLPHAFTQSGRYFNTHISDYTGGGRIIEGNGRVTVWR